MSCFCSTLAVHFTVIAFERDCILEARRQQPAESSLLSETTPTESRPQSCPFQLNDLSAVEDKKTGSAANGASRDASCRGSLWLLSH